MDWGEGRVINAKLGQIRFKHRGGGQIVTMAVSSKADVRGAQIWGGECPAFTRHPPRCQNEALQSRGATRLSLATDSTRDELPISSACSRFELGREIITNLRLMERFRFFERRTLAHPTDTFPAALESIIVDNDIC